jgi:hypothetical protein
VVAVESLSPFQTVLSARRDTYNARFRLARHRARSLDPQAFLTHLREVVGPVVDAAPNPVPVADALVDLSLRLATTGRLRPDDAIDDGMRRLLPELVDFLAADPGRLPVAVVNALHHLDASPTGDPTGWIDTMTAVARQLDPATGAPALLDAGAVAAWRHGLAQLRDVALDTARRLPDDLTGTALNTESTVDSLLLDQLADDPWLDPSIADDEPVLLLARRVGGFRGFGGTFHRPPRVSTSHGRWYASDGDGCWQVFADRFGVSLRRLAAPPAEDYGSGDLRLTRGGVVTDRVTGAMLELPELADATSWAASGTTLAATTPWSHGILFVARTVG